MIDAGRCSVKQGDVSELQLPAGRFALSTAFETVYFWPELERCFAQVADVLKPGGLFLICNESDGRDQAGRKFEKIIDGMKCYPADEIEAALKRQVFLRCTRTIIHPGLGFLCWQRNSLFFGETCHEGYRNASGNVAAVPEFI